MPPARPARRALMFLHSPLRHDSRVEREARALVAAGWHVRIIAANDPLSRRQADEAYERRDGFEIVRVDRYPLPAKALHPLRLLLERRRATSAIASRPTAAVPEAGAAQAQVSLPRRWAVAAYLWLDHRKYLRRAVKEATRWPAELFICHDLSTLPAGAEVKRRAGGALIYDSHELFLDRTPPAHELAPERWRWRRMERSLIGRADVTVTVCDSIADTLAGRYGVPRPQVVRNLPERRADDGRAQDVRRLAGLVESARVVLHLGALGPNRGLETLIAAMAQLEAGELVLLGPGEPTIARRLAATAEHHGIARRVHFVPPVPASEVVPVARSADVGVAPIENSGLNHLYSLPNKLFEYLHAGLPVVASDLPELGRVVTEHDVGETFRPGDPSDLARALRAVLEPERHERLAASARMAADQLNWDSERARFLQALELALQRAGGAAR